MSSWPPTTIATTVASVGSRTKTKNRFVYVISISLQVSTQQLCHLKATHLLCDMMTHALTRLSSIASLVWLMAIHKRKELLYPHMPIQLRPAFPAGPLPALRYDDACGYAPVEYLRQWVTGNRELWPPHTAGGPHRIARE